MPQSARAPTIASRRADGAVLQRADTTVVGATTIQARATLAVVEAVVAAGTSALLTLVRAVVATMAARRDILAWTVMSEPSRMASKSPLPAMLVWNVSFMEPK